jgi:phosphotransacetylase
MMVYLGQADGMVSGAVHTTGHTIRPGAKFEATQCIVDPFFCLGNCAFEFCNKRIIIGNMFGTIMLKR